MAPPLLLRFGVGVRMPRRLPALVLMDDAV